MTTVLKKALATCAVFFITSIGVLLTPVDAQGAEPVLPTKYQCATTYFPSGDDNSYQMTLPFNLKLGTVTYSQVFVSINGLISFGSPDGNFSDYPQTPSISLAGNDWVTWGQDAYLRYGSTADTLCIQWAVRPFPQSTGSLTNITLLVDLAPNGSWTGQIITDGWLPNGLRRGIRYTSGEPVVTIDSTFQVGTSGVPVEMQTCWDGSVIPLNATCPAVPEPVLNTRTVQCSWTNPYTQEVVYGTTQQQYYTYWDGSTVDAQTVLQACALVTPPTFTPPDPVVHERTVTCSWTNPYTQEVVNGTATQQYYVYWDGTSVDIDTATQVCANAAPVFPVPLPVIEERTVTCSWANPYTQDVVTDTVSQRFYLYWNGSTEDIDDVIILCANAAPTFVEPDPVLKDRIVQCVWRNPYTLEYVSGEATSQYNLYWNGNEVYVVSPEAACAMATPIFTPIQYPSNAIYITVDENWQLDYTAPTGMRIKEILFASYGTADTATYQYGQCHANNSLEIVNAAVNNNRLNVGASNGVFGDPCGGTYKHLSVVITIEVDPNYIEPTPTPTVEPTPEPTPTVEPTVEPTPEPTPTVEPTEEPTPSPSQTPEPSESPTNNPEPEPTIEPTPTPTQESSVTPVDKPSSPSPEPTPNDEPTNESNPTTPQEELGNLSENLNADGVLTDEEKEQIVDALLAEYTLEQAIPAGLIEELGLDYEDLPPDQPVTLENGVVLTAEVADAIEIFENPTELLATVFIDPTKALKAIANVGADLPPAVRKAAQKVAVASVIVGQVVAGTALTLTRRP